MRYVVAIMAACIAAAPLNAVQAFEQPSNVYVFTDEEVAECGGDDCVMVSKKKLAAKLDEVIGARVKARAGNCMGGALWRPQ